MTQKTAEEWAATLKSRPSYELGEGLTCIALKVEDRDAIAALLVGLSKQVEAANRITDEHAADCLYEDPTCLICRIRAALQEPKT